MEKYELVKDIGSGNFGVARLMRHKDTKELVAMKYIERGHKVCFYSTPFTFTLNPPFFLKKKYLFFVYYLLVQTRFKLVKIAHIRMCIIIIIIIIIMFCFVIIFFN